MRDVFDVFEVFEVSDCTSEHKFLCWIVLCAHQNCKEGSELLVYIFAFIWKLCSFEFYTLYGMFIDLGKIPRSLHLFHGFLCFCCLCYEYR